MAPRGALPLAGSPAPAGSALTSAGMLNITQCHQPLPVGASGSYTVKAKLLVPAGALFHASDGDTFPPSQPKPLYTCASAIVAPGLISALDKVNDPAASATAGSSAATHSKRRSIMPPWGGRREENVSLNRHCPVRNARHRCQRRPPGVRCAMMPG